ncbi:MAG: hypothetical protein Q8O67_20710 [Deltaproteobacteria bacterium]|nr:hypothetical protein [Deltaproteobacteria bacterium]
MTIPGGGGGGKKIPPGGQPLPSTPPTTATTATAKPAATTTPAAPTAPPPAAPDGFESAKTDPRYASQRAGLPSSDPPSVSGIDSMVRILEETRWQILDEHKALREKAIKLVQALAQSGFERALVDQKRTELAELRQRLAALRKRLQHIQRRLKTTLSKTAKQGDVDLSKSIAAHLDKMKKLEPGVQRALLALLALEQAFAGVVDGGVLKLVGDATAEARGSALARMGPGSLVARATTALLRGKPERALLTASTEGMPVAEPVNDDDAGLPGLRAVAETLLASF